MKVSQTIRGVSHVYERLPVTDGMTRVLCSCGWDSGPVRVDADLWQGWDDHCDAVAWNR